MEGEFRCMGGCVRGVAYLSAADVVSKLRVCKAFGVASEPLALWGLWVDAYGSVERRLESGGLRGTVGGVSKPRLLWRVGLWSSGSALRGLNLWRAAAVESVGELC